MRVRKWITLRRIRLIIFSLVLWVAGSPAAGAYLSAGEVEKLSCEAVLAPQVQIYVKLLETALQAKIISEQDLANLNADNLNPLQGKERTHQNIALHQGLAKTVNALSPEAKEQALIQIAKIRGDQSVDVEETLKAKRETENVFAPKLDKTINGMWPKLDGRSKHSEIFFHHDDAGDWLIVAEETRLHVVNIEDPTQRQTFELPLMTNPKGLSARDGKFYLAFVSGGKFFVFDFKSGTLANLEHEQDVVESVQLVEDKSGRRFLLATYGASNSRLRVFEHTSELKYRSQVDTADWRKTVDVVFGQTGGMFLPHYTIVLNHNDNTYAHYVEVFDLIENKIVQRWPVDGTIRKVTGFVDSDGKFTLAATRNVADLPILFFQTGSDEVKASGIITIDESTSRWLETKDGRVLFSIYANGQITGTFNFHIYEPFPQTPPIGKLARFMKMFKKGEIQIVLPLFSAPRKAYTGSSSWTSTYASNESFWMRLREEDIYVEAHDNKVQQFAWQNDAMVPVGNASAVVADRSSIEGAGPSVFDPQTAGMYVVFGSTTRTSESVWWSSQGLVKSTVVQHDPKLQALGVARTGEVIYALVGALAPGEFTKNILIYKLTRPLEERER